MGKRDEVKDTIPSFAIFGFFFLTQHHVKLETSYFQLFQIYSLFM